MDRSTGGPGCTSRAQVKVPHGGHAPNPSNISAANLCFHLSQTASSDRSLSGSLVCKMSTIQALPPKVTIQVSRPVADPLGPENKYTNLNLRWACMSSDSEETECTDDCLGSCPGPMSSGSPLPAPNSMGSPGGDSQRRPRYLPRCCVLPDLLPARQGVPEEEDPVCFA